MRTRFLGSFGTLLAGVGLAWAQSSSTSPSATPKAAPNPAANVSAAPAASASCAEGAGGLYNPTAALDNLPPPNTYECTFGGCKDFGRDVDFWVGAEYLLWWTRQPSLNEPVVTTGPANSFGILGTAGVSVLSGQQEIDFGPHSGGRLTLGAGIPGLGVGLESTSFVLEKGGMTFLRASDASGSPTLARPVVDALLGRETSSLIASPGAFSGGVIVDANSQFYGTEINLVRACVAADWLYADWIIGFRYAELREDLTIAQRSNLLANGRTGFNGDLVTAPATITIGDSYRAKNQFYGGNIGAQGEVRLGNLFVYSAGKLALGNTHCNVDLFGGSSRFGPGASVQSVPGGLLILPGTNMALHSRNNFSLIPELNVNVGYQFNRHLRIFAGYTLIFWDDLQRPYDQLIRTVNPNRLPTSEAFGRPGGPPVPFEKGATTDFWAQGLNAGLVFRY